MGGHQCTYSVMQIMKSEFISNKTSKVYPKTKCVILSRPQAYSAAIIKSRYHDLWINVKLSYSTSTWTQCPTQFILNPLFDGITI